MFDSIKKYLKKKQEQRIVEEQNRICPGDYVKHKLNNEIMMVVEYFDEFKGVGIICRRQDLTRIILEFCEVEKVNNGK